MSSSAAREATVLPGRDAAGTHRDDGDVLRIRDLNVAYYLEHATVAAVTDVSLSVQPGELVGIVGETGSGKSTVLRAAIGLLHPKAKVTGGSIEISGQEIVGASSTFVDRVRANHVAMVFQDPLRALNPVLPVGEQIEEALTATKRMSGDEVRRRVIETMGTVGIADAPRRLRAYPHELSGGLQQRVSIAAAIIRSPDLLLADEPTTALDVTIQDQILELLKQLCRDMAMGVVLVTHDIGVVAQTCHRVAVMYAGRLVELGPVRDVLGQPSHPYTAALLESIPVVGARQTRLQVIPGAPPDLSNPPEGCPFAPRCRHSIERCEVTSPQLELHAHEQWSACIRHNELGSLHTRTAP